jgi:hypothetical protein
MIQMIFLSMCEPPFDLEGTPEDNRSIGVMTIARSKGRRLKPLSSWEP